MYKSAMNHTTQYQSILQNQLLLKEDHNHVYSVSTGMTTRQLPSLGTWQPDRTACRWRWSLAEVDDSTPYPRPSIGANPPVVGHQRKETEPAQQLLRERQIKKDSQFRFGSGKIQI